MLVAAATLVLIATSSLGVRPEAKLGILYEYHTPGGYAGAEEDYDALVAPSTYFATDEKVYVRTYIHTCMHAYILYACIHTCSDRYQDAYIHTRMHTNLTLIKIHMCRVMHPSLAPPPALTRTRAPTTTTRAVSGLT